MLPAGQVPVSDGRGASFLNYELPVRLRRQVANLGSSRLPAAFILRMEAVARQLRSAAWGDLVANKAGAGRILAISKDCFAPYAGGSAY